VSPQANLTREDALTILGLDELPDRVTLSKLKAAILRDLAEGDVQNQMLMAFMRLEQVYA
jgi:hypothetical protein